MELKNLFDADVELVAGSGGVFQVSVDGREIFSKKSTNRFPHEGEVVALLQKE